MTETIAVAGAGAFGTALAVALAAGGARVRLWARDGAAEIDAARENRRRLPGRRLDPAIAVTSDPAALAADILLVATPTQSMAAFLAAAAPQAGAYVSCAKGIEATSGDGPTAILRRFAGGRPVAQLTGPAFADDIAAGAPTALTLACENAEAGAALQAALSTPALRLYTTTDVTGAELGGALKNVLAIGCGAAIGAGLGESARAALLTRGFAEMTRLAVARGADPSTLAGLSGLGDLVLTATSERSRNFRLGLALGRGAEAPAETQEGLSTAERLAREAIGDMPVLDAVARLARGEADVARLAEMLLSRPLKAE